MFLTHLPRLCFWFSLQSSPTASIHPDHHFLFRPMPGPLPPPGTCAVSPLSRSFSTYCRWSCPVTHLIASLICLPWLPCPQVQGQNIAPKALNNGLLPSSLAWSPRKSGLSQQAPFLLLVLIQVPCHSAPRAPTSNKCPRTLCCLLSYTVWHAVSA